MAPALAPWKAIEFAYVFAMWAVMMVGMMTPSAAPMILIHARVGRQALLDRAELDSDARRQTTWALEPFGGRFP
jgi:predicted metal-binding membrane protein